MRASDAWTLTGDGTEQTPLVLESCSFVWLFDERRKLYRRVPRGAAIDAPAPADIWAPYHRLEVNVARSSFAVLLDERGTLILRCWIHGERCPRCDSGGERRLTMDELRSLVHWWKSRIGLTDGSDRAAPGPLRGVYGQRRRNVFGR